MGLSALDHGLRTLQRDQGGRSGYGRMRKIQLKEDCVGLGAYGDPQIRRKLSQGQLQPDIGFVQILDRAVNRIGQMGQKDLHQTQRGYPSPLLHACPAVGLPKISLANINMDPIRTACQHSRNVTVSRDGPVRKDLGGCLLGRLKDGQSVSLHHVRSPFLLVALIFMA